MNKRLLSSVPMKTWLKSCGQSCFTPYRRRSRTCPQREVNSNGPTASSACLYVKTPESVLPMASTLPARSIPNCFRQIRCRTSSANRKKRNRNTKRATETSPPLKGKNQPIRTPRPTRRPQTLESRTTVAIPQKGKKVMRFQGTTTTQTATNRRQKTEKTVANRLTAEKPETILTNLPATETETTATEKVMKGAPGGIVR